MSATQPAPPTIRRAVLIVEDPTGKTGYPATAEQLAEVGIEDVAKAMGWIVDHRLDATSVTLRIELDGRTVTSVWSPHEATAGQFTIALRRPSLLFPLEANLETRRYSRGRWTLRVVKEVGPPRWWWPRAGVSVDRRGLWAMAGWSFTAVHVLLYWSDAR